jgi:hypothetical protein
MVEITFGLVVLTAISLIGLLAACAAFIIACLAWGRVRRQKRLGDN